MAPRKSAIVVPPRVEESQVAVLVGGSLGDYRAGDELWCDTLESADYGRALNRDVLVPRPAGRFLFGRLINRDEEQPAGSAVRDWRSSAGRRQSAVDRGRRKTRAHPLSARRQIAPGGR